MIVVPSLVEAKCLLPLFKNIKKEKREKTLLYTGTLLEKKVQMQVTGMGRENTCKNLQLDFIEKNKKIYLVGFCGGLSPQSKKGNCIDLKNVQNALGDKISLNQESEETHISVLELVKSPTSKKELFEKWGASSVDLELFDQVRLVKEAGFSCEIVKIVLDEATETLPEFISEFSRRKAHELDLRERVEELSSVLRDALVSSMRSDL